MQVPPVSSSGLPTRRGRTEDLVAVAGVVGDGRTPGSPIPGGKTGSRHVVEAVLGRSWLESSLAIPRMQTVPRSLVVEATGTARLHRSGRIRDRPARVGIVSSSRRSPSAV